MLSKDSQRLILTLLIALFVIPVWNSVSEADCTWTTTPLSPGVAAADGTTNQTNLRLQNVNSAILRKPNTPCATNPNAGAIGIFIMHSFSSYTGFTACTELAKRGYVTLCADSVFTNRQQEYKGYEDHAQGVRRGIDYLRTVVGVQKALIFGHSMGAPMMAFYQNVAENTAAVACQGPEKIIACDATNLSNLPKADGVILFDSHLGDALATFTYVDPAVKKDSKPGIRNVNLDMFDPSNGYPGDTAAGSPTFKSATYDDKFKRRFLDGQANRNADLLQDAQSIWSDIQAEKPELYPDNMPFIVPGADGAARLWQADTSLVNCTKNQQIFLTHTGTLNPSPGPICSVRIPSASAADDDSFDSVEKVNVRVWLGAHALRTNGRYDQTKDDITGIDYDSSATSTVSMVKGIGKHPNGSNVTTPLLIVANGGHYFLRPDEIVYENANSTTDKTFAIEEGAVHGGGPCTQCAQALGLPQDYFGDTNKRTYDFMDQWLSKAGRFLP